MKKTALSISALFYTTAIPAMAHDQVVVYSPPSIEANINWFEAAIDMHNNHIFQHATAVQDLINQHDDTNAQQLYLCAYNGYQYQIAHYGPMAENRYNYSVFYTLETFNMAAQDTREGCANMNSPEALGALVQKTAGFNHDTVNIMRRDHMMLRAPR